MERKEMDRADSAYVGSARIGDWIDSHRRPVLFAPFLSGRRRSRIRPRDSGLLKPLVSRRGSRQSGLAILRRDSGFASSRRTAGGFAAAYPLDGMERLALAASTGGIACHCTWGDSPVLPHRASAR